MSFLFTRCISHQIFLQHMSICDQPTYKLLPDTRRDIMQQQALLTWLTVQAVCLHIPASLGGHQQGLRVTTVLLTTIREDSGNCETASSSLSIIV